MVESFILLIIITFCLLAERQKIILLFICLLPFHNFIKNSLDFYLHESGSVFAFWKEIAILILGFKVLMRNHYKVNKSILLLISGYFFYITIFFLLAPHLTNGLPALRDNVFPFLLLFAVWSLPLEDEMFIKKINLAFCTVVFLSGIMGIVQLFFLKMPIAMIMGRIEIISNSGYIQYSTNSARIMGFERMAGIIGGPNDFGLFMAISILFLLNALLNLKYLRFSKSQTRFLITTLMLAIICIIFSFSRAGWVIIFVGGILLLRLSKVRISAKYIVLAFLFFVIFSVVIINYFPKVIDIVTASLTGEEASASTRESMVYDGITRVADEPLGHGIGTTDHRNRDFEFFTESAYVNLSYEIGILGLLYLILVNFSLLVEMLGKKSFRAKFFSKLSVAVLVPTVVVSFASVNTYGMPFIYFSSLALGLGLNNSEALNIKGRDFSKKIKLSAIPVVQ